MVSIWVRILFSSPPASRTPALARDPRSARRCRSFPLRQLLAHTRLDFLESIRTTRRVPRRPVVRLHTVELPMRDAPGGLAGLIGGPRPILLGGVLDGGTAKQECTAARIRALPHRPIIGHALRPASARPAPRLGRHA